MNLYRFQNGKEFQNGKGRIVEVVIPKMGHNPKTKLTSQNE
jgi:hypothetical protein